MQDNIETLLAKLKYNREILEKVTAQKKAIQEDMEARLTPARNAQTVAEQTCADLERRVKEMAVQAYYTDGTRKPAVSVEVKMFTETTIDKPDTVREWCFTNLPAALVVDDKKVKKYAVDFGAVPGVTVTKDIPRAQIASKL
jgi:hypothetical protein